MWNYDNLPESVRNFPNWVLWRYEQKEDGTKPAKVPMRPNGKRADPTNPDHHISFDKAYSTYIDDQLDEEKFDGIGIALTEGCGYVGIDLDDTDEWKSEAKGILKTFAGKSYAEISPSGNGVRIIVKAKVPDGSRKRGKHFFGGKVEVYDKDRFLTITGSKGQGQIYDADMSDIVAEFMAPLNAGASKELTVKDDDERLLQESNLSDEQVVDEMAAMAAKGLPGAVTFMRLFTEGFEGGDASDDMASAVSSMVNVTRNMAQIERVLKMSEFIADYRDSRTNIPKLDRWIQNEVPKIIVRKTEDLRIEAEERHAMLSEEGYLDRFVWVGPDAQFYDTVAGVSYPKSALNDTYRHIHTGSQGDPLLGNMLLNDPDLCRCQGKGWIPVKYGEDKSAVINHMGTKLVNTWRGFGVTPMEGDVSPWLRLLEHISPDPEEREHALKRLAYDIQYPDEKCNWHLVIIGIQGAGKDSLMMPIARIYGDAYSIIGNGEVKSQYDDGFAKRKMIHVNEVRGLKGDPLEKVKRRSATQGQAWELLNIKSERQITHPNLWSFVFLTNHRDAMNIDIDERRFFVLYASTPMPEDLQKEYFMWLDKQDGSAKLFRYLLDVDLSGFNPSRVPMRTKAFMDMVEDSKSDAQIDLEEILLCGGFGFAEGLVNTKIVSDAVKSRGPYCRPADVEAALRKQGWKKVKHINGAVKKINDVPKRVSRLSWAPIDSELHNLKGAKLYDAIKKITDPDDFLDE